MKAINYNIVRYDADEDKVFDWKEERWHDVFDEHLRVIGKEQDHLYVKTIFIGPNDSIDNYIEVEEV